MKDHEDNRLARMVGKTIRVRWGPQGGNDVDDVRGPRAHRVNPRHLLGRWRRVRYQHHTISRGIQDFRVRTLHVH